VRKPTVAATISPLNPVITDFKFGERRASEIARQGQPLALADRIERFGRALNATQLAAVLAVSKIVIYKLAKAGRIPSFRIGTCVRFDPKAIAAWLRVQ
jgi:excisionase family DNA binding protein